MIQFSAIGHAETQYTNVSQMPIQGAGIANNSGRIVIKPEYAQGLSDLDGFSHIYVLFHLHQSKAGKLLVKPFLDKVKRGIFATRSPQRPNPIGLSILTIKSIEDNIINVQGVDLLNGTPILDIKPYIQAFDNIPNTRDGWYQQGKDPQTTLSDNRFE